MIFEDPRFDQYTMKVNTVLKAFNKFTALDIACGYGRFCENFNPENYIGVDFSENMIDLAKKTYPKYIFENGDARKGGFTKRKYDVVFEVNSLKSLNMSAAQFIEEYGKYANLFVCCLEADEFIIRPVYHL